MGRSRASRVVGGKKGLPGGDSSSRVSNVSDESLESRRRCGGRFGGSDGRRCGRVGKLSESDESNRVCACTGRTDLMVADGNGLSESVESARVCWGRWWEELLEGMRSRSKPCRVSEGSAV